MLHLVLHLVLVVLPGPLRRVHTASETNPCLLQSTRGEHTYQQVRLRCKRGQRRTVASSSLTMSHYQRPRYSD